MRPPFLEIDLETMRLEVCGAVHYLGPGVLVLSGGGEGHREDFAAGAGLEHVDGRILHGEPAAEVAVDPFDQGVLVGGRPLGHQVVNVVGPVLDGRVADARAFLCDHLDDGGVQAFAAVHGGRAAFDVMHLGPFIDDNQRPLELAHLRGVDAEIGLQGELDLHPRRHVDERPARPDRRIQGGKLVVGGGNQGAEILPHQVGIVAQAGIHVAEDHALLGQLLLERAVDHLALVLGLHAGEELLLRLRDAQLVEGALDLGGHVVPGAALLADGLEVVVDFLEVDGDPPAPLRHGLGLEDLQALEPEVAHPRRLALHVRNFGDDAAVESLAGLEDVFLVVAEVVFIDLADGVARGSLFIDLADRIVRGSL